LTAADVVLSCLPTTDTSFARFVARRRRELPRGLSASPAELQAAIRRWYPRAVIREQTDLGSLGRRTWYVYRDGSPNVATHDHWWTEPGTARVEFDAEARFVAADDHAAEIVGFRPGELVGKTWRDVVHREAQAENPEWVWQTLDETGRVMSVFDCPLPDGRWRVVEYRSQTTDDPDRYVSFWRELVTLEQRPGS
jgi:PAS domain S-box-containing protein